MSTPSSGRKTTRPSPASEISETTLRDRRTRPAFGESQTRSDSYHAPGRRIRKNQSPDRWQIRRRNGWKSTPQACELFTFWLVAAVAWERAENA
jgi:hypothetical protein